MLLFPNGYQVTRHVSEGAEPCKHLKPCLTPHETGKEKNTSHRATEQTEFKRRLFGFVEFVVFIEVNNGNT